MSFAVLEKLLNIHLGCLLYTKCGDKINALVTKNNNKPTVVATKTKHAAEIM